MENITKNTGKYIPTYIHTYIHSIIIYYNLILSLSLSMYYVRFVSDNSWNKDMSSRLNYRCLTCIYYMNTYDDDWDYKKDGGALRIYKQSSHYPHPKDVLSHKGCDYVDINPTNGKLLLFDSTLIHSVQKVTSPIKKRFAFTLWTLRPIDNPYIVGETYDIGQTLPPQ